MSHLSWPTRSLSRDGTGGNRSSVLLQEAKTIPQNRLRVLWSRINERCTCSCKRPCRHMEPLSSWIKLVAVFCMNILVAIPDTTFGLFYDPIIDLYGSTRAEIGFAFSILVTIGLVIGLFASPFLDLYGCRSVSLVGAGCYTGGMLVAAYAPNLIVFCIFYGGLAGLGLGIVLMSGMTVILNVFTFNRGLATAMMAFGFTFGTILVPPLIEHLLSVYDIQGALLIHCGLIAHSIPLALLFKTNAVQKVENDDDDSDVSEQKFLMSRSGEETNLNDDDQVREFFYSPHLGSDEIADGHNAYGYEYQDWNAVGTPVVTYDPWLDDNYNSYPLSSAEEEDFETATFVEQDIRIIIDDLINECIKGDIEDDVTSNPNIEYPGDFTNEPNDYIHETTERGYNLGRAHIAEIHASNLNCDKVSLPEAPEIDDHKYERTSTHQVDLDLGTEKPDGDDLFVATPFENQDDLQASGIENELSCDDKQSESEHISSFEPKSMDYGVNVTNTDTEVIQEDGEHEKPKPVDKSESEGPLEPVVIETTEHEESEDKEDKTENQIQDIGDLKSEADEKEKATSLKSLSDISDEFAAKQAENTSNENKIDTIQTSNEDEVEEDAVERNNEDAPKDFAESDCSREKDSDNQGESNVLHVQLDTSPSSTGDTHDQDQANGQIIENTDASKAVIEIPIHKTQESEGTTNDLELQKSTSSNTIDSNSGPLKTVETVKEEPEKDNLNIDTTQDISRNDIETEGPSNDNDQDSETEINKDVYHEDKPSKSNGQMNSSEHDHEEESPLVNKDAFEKKKKFNLAKEVFKNFKDFSICREPAYVLFIFCNLASNIARVMFVVQFPSAALAQGIPSKDVAGFVSVIGFSNGVLRLISCFIMNFKWFNAIAYYVFGMACLTVAIFVAASAVTYSTMVVCVVIIGISEGTAYTVFPLTMAAISGVERFPKALGLLNAAVLVGPLLAGPFSGWLVDISGDYLMSFLVAGFCGALSTILGICVIVVHEVRKRRSEKLRLQALADLEYGNEHENLDTNENC